VPANSHISVLDPKGNEVDSRVSRVSGSNPREMSVTLAKLPAGTYTVLWVAQSTDDGHITEGSFVFSVTLPDGTVPPLPAGASSAGGGTSFMINGPILLQALATWLALLGLTFWVGGLIWETWVLTPGAQDDPDLARVSWAASRRFRRLVPYALGTVLLADVALLLGQAAAVTGNWSSAFAISSLQSILFGSRFGLFWWIRQCVVLAALALWGLSARRGWLPWSEMHQEAARGDEAPPVPNWWRGVIQVIRGIPHLPVQLLMGWRRSAWVERTQILLGAVLLVAFAFSGHAAAVLPSQLGFSISVDLLHLVGNVAWVGGLFYIGLVLVPELGKLNTRSRARVLARGLPAFSVLAITSAAILAATGQLVATVHMTSFQQFLTTFYGWTLAVKIECFLVMVAISTYHAFFLRPRLAQELAPSTPGAPGLAQVKMASASVSGKAIATSGVLEMPSPRPGDQDDERNVEQVQRLAERMETWLLREAALGGVVLLCTALLTVVFAGTLAPPI
jgi:copper transport protein